MQELGLYGKYNVYRPGSNELVSDCFVLKISDPHARVALKTYADSIQAENPTLATAQRNWVALAEGAM